MERTIYFLPICLLVSMICNTVYAEVSVFVSPNYSALSYFDNTKISGGQEQTLRLPHTYLDDRYHAVINVTSGQIFFAFGYWENMEAEDRSWTNLYQATIEGKHQINIPDFPRDATAIIYLVNKLKLPVDLSIQIFRTGTRDQGIRQAIGYWVSRVYKSVDDIYLLPDLKITVTPCGEANAFSSPDITICTELFAEIEDKKIGPAINAVIAHELAHSLLKIWGLPGWDNEEFADEFTLVALKDQPDAVEAFIAWLEDKDPVAEALLQIVVGDTHGLSIQRARTLRRKMASRQEVLERWEKLLKQYKR